MSTPVWVEETRDCTDPECGGTMEPEEDGNLHYFACTTCQREDYYDFVKETTPGCQLGVPEHIRSAAQPPPQPAPVFLGTIGRRPNG